jgi:hypothetical protein
MTLLIAGAIWWCSKKASHKRTCKIFVVTFWSY